VVEIRRHGDEVGEAGRGQQPATSTAAALPVRNSLRSRSKLRMIASFAILHQLNRPLTAASRPPAGAYPQRYGKPDPTTRGATGAKNRLGESTWGGLAAEVRHWGNHLLNQVRTEIGVFYPLVPDPDFKGKRGAVQSDWLNEQSDPEAPAGYLRPAAYLWTRAVTCKNPHCGATVPLVKQTWLCKKPGRYVALKIVALKGKKQVRFVVVETTSEKSLGFDPESGSKRGNATCPFCGTVADNDYIKSEGCAGRITTQLMALVCTTSHSPGKKYLGSDEALMSIPNQELLKDRTVRLT
jgi:putative DNA methylase